MERFHDHPLYPGYPDNPGQGSVIYLSAGPAKTAESLKPFLDIKDPATAPVITLGSIINIPWAGNRKSPNDQDFVYDIERQAAGNALGLPGNGRDDIYDAKPIVRELMARGIRVSVSVTNLPFQKPLEVVPDLAAEVQEVLEPTSIEVNLSCPNGVKEDGSFHPQTCEDEDLSVEVMHDTREAVGHEAVLGGKDGAHTTSPEVMPDEQKTKRLVRAVLPYIDFWVGINTIAGQPFDGLTVTNGRGGMSGPIIAPVARQHLQYCLEEVPDLFYISVGGVDTQNVRREVHDRLAMGATLVGGAQQFYRSAWAPRETVEWLLRI